MKTIARHFWRRMIYACDACPTEFVFLLEDGCEGPDDGERVRVPVPFTAGRCPSCLAADVHPGRGYLRHARWDEDSDVDLTVESEPDQPYFAYPSRTLLKRARRAGERVCGRPVIPEWTRPGSDDQFSARLNPQKAADQGGES